MCSKILNVFNKISFVLDACDSHEILNIIEHLDTDQEALILAKEDERSAICKQIYDTCIWPLFTGEKQYTTQIFNGQDGFFPLEYLRRMMKSYTQQKAEEMEIEKRVQIFSFMLAFVRLRVRRNLPIDMKMTKWTIENATGDGFFESENPSFFINTMDRYKLLGSVNATISQIENVEGSHYIYSAIRRFKELTINDLLKSE